MNRSNHRCLALLASLTLILGTNALGAQNCASPGADMVAWWDGDQVSGGAAGDLVGTNPLTSTAGAAQAGGIVGSALAFDGTDAAVLTAGGRVLNTTGAWSIEGWIRPSSSINGLTATIVSELSSSGPYEGEFALRRLPNSTVQILRKAGNGAACFTLTSSATVPSGLWTHVVAVFGASNPNADSDLRLYINGNRVTNGVASSIFGVSTPAEMRVGATEPGTSLWVGEIDELTLYRRALPQTEVLAGFLASVDGRCKAPSTAAQDPWLWWTGDEACGSFELDSTAGASMELRNGVARAPGMDASGFRLDGSNDYLGAGRAAVATTGPLTVEAWVRPDRLHTGTVVSELGAAAPGGLEGQFALRYLVGGQVQFLRTDGLSNCGGGSRTCVDTRATTAVVPVGQWSHVAATWSNGTIRVYVNGALDVGSASRSHIDQTNPLETQLGFYGDILPFDGSIDDAAVYRRALSVSEIESHYRAGRWGKVRTAVNQVRCIQGSQTGLNLESRVNGGGVPAAPQKFLRAGDLLDLGMVSPSGVAVGEIPIIAMNLFPEGAGPGPDSQFPALYIHRPTQIILYNGLLASPLGFGLLPTGGLHLAALIPGGLEGMTLRLQGVTLGAGIRISEAHDLEIRF